MALSSIYKKGLRSFINKAFPLCQRLGFHITPNHFYEPVPDTRTLKDELWQRRSGLVGIRWNEEAQLGLLARFVSDYKQEYESLPRDKTAVSHQYYINNGSFDSVDGEALYSMIRHFKPRTYFEIGSGFSTMLAAQAISENRSEGGHRCRLIACDPFPCDVLKAGFPGLDELRAAEAQSVPLSEFDNLQENDILFIDSSHVLKIGSDVQYEYLEILPRLGRGVLVHLHDIFLPEEYPRQWVMKHRRFWNEQYLLQAFLSFNDSFEVVWAASFMHLNHPEKLEQAFSSYSRAARWPGSFWMKKVK